MWDGGSGRATHQEFGSRMVVKDGSASIDHATHVGGTMIATGVVASARGMANAAVVDSYDWNSDLTEMTNRGATGIGQESTRVYLSNHSYGYLSGWSYVGNTGTPTRVWEWYGSGTLATSIEDDFGRYNTYSRDVDALSASAPYYLIFQSAGNERTDNPTNGQAVALSPGSATVVTYDSAIHPRGDGSYRSGFESLGYRAVAKNVITVGATTDAVAAGVRSPSSANSSSYSSWGPTDDGRIKPDVVANGDGLYSSLNGSDTAYGTYSGTSMSTPNACGSAALLVQQYQQLYPGQAMRSATLKGLLIHTADDRGNAGPDYKFGWGLVNVKAAADLLIDHQANPNKLRVIENQLSSSITSRTHSFLWDGVSPIRATLSWTDPAASATTTSDFRTSRLVNNLHVKMIAPNGVEYLPYVMPFVGTWTEASMDLPATTGVNNTDNVEQVFASSPAQAGTWSVVVSFSGSLTNNLQNYSLLLSGSSNELPPPPPLSVASISPSSGLSNSIVTVDITGTSLRADSIVILTKSGESNITGSANQMVGENLRCQFNLANAAAGLWSLTVTNPDNSTSTLTDAFTVLGSVWNENFDATVTGWSFDPNPGTNSWNLTSSGSYSPNTCYFAAAPASKTTTSLLSPTIVIPASATNLQFKFWHNFSLQTNRDGGQLQFSVNGGSWFDAGSLNSGTDFSNNGYNATINNSGSPGSRSDFGGQSAWSGNSNGYIETIVNLTDTATFAGKSFRARWTLATDGSIASTGWRIDNVSLLGGGDLSNQPPSIATAANSSSTQSQTDGDGSVWKIESATSTTLSVTATDSGGESNLTYTWSSTGPTTISFTPNATNSAKTCTAEFSKAGDYTVIVTVQDAQGLATSSSVNLRVIQTATGLVVTPTVASLAVGGTQSFQASQLDQFGAVMTAPPSPLSWSTNGGGTISSAGVFTATSAGGPYTVTAQSGSFSDFASVTVNPLPATITLSGLQQTYNGQARVVSATTQPSGLPVSILYNGQSSPPVAAGNYTIEAHVADPNYQGSAQALLEVAKAQATISFGSLEATYDGTAKAASAVTSPEGLTVNLTYNGSTTAPTAAGTYPVVATINDPNYEGTASGNLFISKAVATVTLGNLATTYDGTAKVASALTSPEGLTVNLTYDGSTTAPTAAGSYPVVATIVDANYEGVANGTLVIAKATAKVTLGNLSATYDGTAKAASSVTSPEGLTVNLTYNGSTTAPTAVGTYPVVATINDPNYEGTATGNLLISKAVATVTLGDLEVTYDGTPKSISATTVPAGLQVEILYNGSLTAPTAVGTYPIQATVIDDNHSGEAQATFVIKHPYDIWKEANFTTNQINDGTADPQADPDGDGMSNWVECHIGFQPLNQDSHLKNEMTVENGNLNLTINRVVTKGTFTIQSSDNLDGTWENVMLLNIQENSDQHGVILPKNGAKRFYRVLYQAPPLP
jgi:uncharacterized protein with FMN-binding domain